MTPSALDCSVRGDTPRSSDFVAVVVLTPGRAIDTAGCRDVRPLAVVIGERGA